MSWLDSAIAYLFPSALVEGTPWRSIWEEKERRFFVVLCRIFFAVAALGYFGHYFFFDVAMGLEPLEFWFAFRMSMALLLGATCAFYFSPFVRIRAYKVPAAIALWAMCYTQARVTVWYSIEAWMFCFIFVVAGVLLLRTSALKSAAFALVVVATQIPSLLEAGLPATYAASASVVTLIMVAVFRSGYVADVRNFLLNQENIAAQRKIIELNIEFTDRIRAFIPRVIADRLESFVEGERMTVLQASVEVLRPRKRDVACLFSDIRGFTRGSKALEAFVDRSVIPEVKTCSDIVETHFGIPRKIGDLVFVYWDDASVERNVLRALVSGMEIARMNEDMNATVSEVSIRRYILISCGEAIVGNIGGLDSSIEITALGTPVNFLSRLDEATKHPRVGPLLKPNDLIVCERTMAILRDSGVTLDALAIDLRSLGVSIRDFPETSAVYSIKATDVNYGRLLSMSEAPADRGDEVTLHDRTAVAQSA